MLSIFFVCFASFGFDKRREDDMPEVGQDMEPEVHQDAQVLNLGRTKLAGGVCLRPGVSKTSKIVYLFSIKYLPLNFQ